MPNIIQGTSNELPYSGVIEVNGRLADIGMSVRSGTLVNTPIIDGSSSTKSKAGSRAHDMSSTEKGSERYFELKAHVGVDARSGAVHSLETTMTKGHNSRVWDELLHGAETSVRGDKGSLSAKREAVL